MLTFGYFAVYQKYDKSYYSQYQVISLLPVITFNTTSYHCYQLLQSIPGNITVTSSLQVLPKIFFTM